MNNPKLSIKALPRPSCAQMSRTLFAVFAPLLLAAVLQACSMGQIVARSSLPLIESGRAVMDRETDLDLAQAALPAQLKLIEGLIAADPSNRALKLHAATGLYGYAFSFVEEENAGRASALYRRGFDYARSALESAGLQGDLLLMPAAEFETALGRLDKNAVPEMFWTASNWAKWIDVNRHDVARLAEIGKAASLMQRVVDLDERYYNAGAHIFFGIYYGARPPMFGGNFEKSAAHFARADALNDGKLLVVDVFRAEFLARQMGDRKLFHDALTRVLSVPLESAPELALYNAYAQRKAARLLAKEDQLF